MYGYVVPNKSTLSSSDFVLYRSFYCGMCCQLGRMYGQLPRFTTSYDFALLTALYLDYARADVIIEERTCVLNPVRKKAVLSENPLLKKLAAANILLCYQKAEDGIADGEGVKYRVVRKMLKKPCECAKLELPKLWERLCVMTGEQLDAERKNVSSIDRAAEPFASFMRDMPELVLGEKTDDNFKSLCYNIGKFVYIADALDDITEDCKRKRYNPFLAKYGKVKSRRDFLEANKSELELILKSVCTRAQAAFLNLNLIQSRSLIKNIVFDGLNGKTAELLASSKKLKSPRI